MHLWLFISYIVYKHEKFLNLKCKIILGLKIFDVCGDADLAERQLEILFPELKAEDAPSNCSPNDEHSIIGLIDFIGFSDYPIINRQLVSFNIAFLSIQLDDFLPAEEVAEVS